MVTQYGMSEKFGLIGLESVQNRYLDGRAVMNCSDQTATEIDKEVMKIIKECYANAKQMLEENIDVLNKISDYLYEKETITGKQFMKIFHEIKGIPEEDEEKQESADSENVEHIDVYATEQIEIPLASNETENETETDAETEKQ